MSKFKTEKWRKQFLNSKAWKEMRNFVIQRDRYVCADCGEVIGDSPEVHHIIELTEQNYLDPDISLNPDLLETLHHNCHDKRHNRFGKYDKKTIVNDKLDIDYSKRYKGGEI